MGVVPLAGLTGTLGAVATYEVSQITVRFSDPYWLLAGLLTCLVLIGIWRGYDVRQHAALAQFVAPHLRHRLTSSVSGSAAGFSEAFSWAQYYAFAPRSPVR